VKKIISVVPSGNKVVEPKAHPKKFIRKHPPKRTFEISFSDLNHLLTADIKVFSNKAGCFFDDVLELNPTSRKLIKPQPVQSVEFPQNWNLDSVIAMCYVVSKSSAKTVRLNELKYASWIISFGEVPITRQIQDDKTHRITRARAMRLLGYFNFKKREMVRARKSEANIAKWALTFVLDIMEGYRGFPKNDDPDVNAFHKNIMYGYGQLMHTTNLGTCNGIADVDITGKKGFIQKVSLIKYVNTRELAFVTLLRYHDQSKKIRYSFFANPLHPGFERIDLTDFYLQLNRLFSELTGTTDYSFGNSKGGGTREFAEINEVAWKFTMYNLLASYLKKHLK
jgi:hypothetical protein